MTAGGTEPVPRAIQVARICDPASGASLVAAHFHGLRDPAGKGDSPDRAAQAEAVVAHLAQIAAPSDPCVLAGDFNLLPGSHSFAVFARLGLADLVTGRGFTSTRTDLYAKKQRFADYLLVNERVRVEGFDVPRAPIVSDHCPLVLDLGRSRRRSPLNRKMLRCCNPSLTNCHCNPPASALNVTIAGRSFSISAKVSPTGFRRAAKRRRFRADRRSPTGSFMRT